MQTQVDGYDAPGSYIRKIKYDISMEDIVAIIKRSQKCEQFVKFECFNAGFWFNHTASWWVQPYSWWVSREGANMTYWGGAQPGSNNCACGMTNNCISGSETKRCNCDQNLSIKTEDSGYLADKNTLPVSELRFGDTLDLWTQEYGFYTLGKLRCWG